MTLLFHAIGYTGCFVLTGRAAIIHGLTIHMIMQYNLKKKMFVGPSAILCYSDDQ